MSTVSASPPRPVVGDDAMIGLSAPDHVEPLPTLHIPSSPDSRMLSGLRNAPVPPNADVSVFEMVPISQRVYSFPLHGKGSTVTLRELSQRAWNHIKADYRKSGVAGVVPRIDNFEDLFWHLKNAGALEDLVEHLVATGQIDHNPVKCEREARERAYESLTARLTETTSGTDSDTKDGVSQASEMKDGVSAPSCDHASHSLLHSPSEFFLSFPWNVIGPLLEYWGTRVTFFVHYGRRNPPLSVILHKRRLLRQMHTPMTPTPPSPTSSLRTTPLSSETPSSEHVPSAPSLQAPPAMSSTLLQHLESTSPASLQVRFSGNIEAVSPSYVLPKTEHVMALFRQRLMRQRMRESGAAPTEWDKDAIASQIREANRAEIAADLIREEESPAWEGIDSNGIVRASSGATAGGLYRFPKVPATPPMNDTESSADRSGADSSTNSGVVRQRSEARHRLGLELPPPPPRHHLSDAEKDAADALQQIVNCPPFEQAPPSIVVKGSESSFYDVSGDEVDLLDDPKAYSDALRTTKEATRVHRRAMAVQKDALDLKGRLQRQLDGIKTQKEQLRLNLEEMNAKCQLLEEKRTEEVTEINTRFEAFRNKTKERLQMHSQRIASLNSSNSTLSDSLRKSQATLSSKESALRALKSKLNTLRRQLEAATQTNKQNLRIHAEEMKSLTAKYEQSEQDIRSSCEQRVKKHSGTALSLQNSLAKAQEKIQLLRREMGEKESRLTKKRDEMHSECQIAQSQLQKRTEEVSSLKKLLEKRDLSKKRRLEEVRQLEAKIGSLNGAVNAEKAKYAQLVASSAAHPPPKPTPVTAFPPVLAEFTDSLSSSLLTLREELSIKNQQIHRLNSFLEGAGRREAELQRAFVELVQSKKRLVSNGPVPGSVAPRHHQTPQRPSASAFQPRASPSASSLIGSPIAATQPAMTSGIGGPFGAGNVFSRRPRGRLSESVSSEQMASSQASRRGLGSGTQFQHWGNEDAWSKLMYNAQKRSNGGGNE